MQTKVVAPCAVLSRGEIGFVIEKGLNLTELDVLILEKTKFMRDTLSSVLRGLGVSNLRAAADLGEAFRLFSSSAPDIVFSDWCPRLDGIDFLRLVRQHPSSPNPYVPVIMVTANTEAHHILTARDNGMTEYLVKPFTATGVYKYVRAVVEKERAFVKHSSFFGPNRRRRNLPHEGEDRRTIH